MLQRPFLAALAAACLAPSGAAHQQLLVDAGRGPIAVHFPDSYDPSSPLPVVLLLHGYTSSGAEVESWLGLTALVDSREFIYAYPDGVKDLFGFRFWNATDACCNLFGLPVDDSQYLSDLLDAIEQVLAVDPRRVHFIGHSNGGFMSHRMACDHAGRVASIASLAGATWNDPLDCDPASPVHALQIHGTQDGTIHYGGGTLLGNPYPSALQSAQQWAGFAGCLLGGLFVPGALDLVATITGPETDVETFAQLCEAGGSAELWTMVGANHSPTFTAEFAPAAVDWLLAHPKLPPPLAYCTAGTSASGCQATLGASGTPSLSQASGFTVSASGAEGAKQGLFFYGFNGPQASPWGNGTSFQCVVPPVVRAPLQTGLGSPGACNGSFARDFNAFWSSAAPSKLPQAGGTTWMQLWYRDPASSSNQPTSLSNALEITVGA